MKIVLTGGSGFIGQHLIPLLSGHHVRLISRKSRPAVIPENVQWITADVGNKEEMREAFVNADILINLAAELRQENNFHSTNISGSKNLIELSKEYKLKKIIHLSSVGVVGMQYSLKPFVVDEESLCDPKNGYEKSKLESENLFKAAGKDIQTIILRPTNVFGDEHPRHVLLNFLKRAKNKKRMICAGKARVNYVYVKDLTESIHYFIHAPVTQQGVFNVGSDMSFKEFYQKCCDGLGVEARILVLPKFIFSVTKVLGYFGIRKLSALFKPVSNHVVYTDSKLLQLFNYKYGIEKGIESTIVSYKNQGLL